MFKILAVPFLFATVAAGAPKPTATVLEVVDNETLSVKKAGSSWTTTVHLDGIDCPDESRFCSSRSWSCPRDRKRGARARTRLQELVPKGTVVELEFRGLSIWKRTEQVTAKLKDGRDLARILISEKLCDSKGWR